MSSGPDQARQPVVSSAMIEFPVGEHAEWRGVSRSAPTLEYWLYRPRRHSRPRRVLVTVHGVSRNVREHVELLRGYADRFGVLLVAPLFNAEVFRDYQRLGRKGIGPRADLALIRLLNEIGRQTGVDTSKVDIFGFSGGAQFAHRFAYAHSQRVLRLVLGSAGWYTMPDVSLPYPYGTSDARGLAAVRLNTLAAARLPTLVVVGEDDDREDDEELNRSRIVMRSQGRHRVERARAWTSAMNALAEKDGVRGSIRMVTLPRIAHSFRQAVLEGGLARLLFEHCYGWEQRPAATDCADRDAAGFAGGRSDQTNRGSPLM
jgi:pimeloyl-ACP methyl ester carboxylesterase